MTRPLPNMQSSTQQSVFVGRQPIYDRDLLTFGYELLFRGCGERNSADVIDDDDATFTVLVNALVEFGLGRLVGRHRAFINLSRNALLSDYPKFFAPNQVILEILENVEPDQPVVDAVRRFKDLGYRVALDDCEYRPELEPLLEYADIIKIDVQAHDEQALAHQVRRFEGIELLAEKVETRAEFELCKDLGFRYFQGYFISRPKVVSIEHVPSSRIGVFRLLSGVHDPKADAARIAEIIGQDPGLSYRLLRAVNSASYGLAVRVESITHAVIMLGLGQIRTWATLLALSGADDLNVPLLMNALTRAKTCENLASHVDDGIRERAFLVGLFSQLDQLMGVPLDEILQHLSLIDEVVDALVSGEGFLGEVLACAMACEISDSENIPLADLEISTIQNSWLDAIEWAEEFRESHLQ